MRTTFSASTIKDASEEFIVTSKLQNLRQLKQDWDDYLLQEFHTKWNQYQQGLVHLKDIEISRCTLRDCAIEKLTLARFALCAALLLALLLKKVTKRLNTNLNGRYF
ncbi:hypothetical protein PV326_007280 [Microctonus aethiopoides]|nr:hypothetical protein PV326_007280 [Microctonus aethiopoides]